MAPEKAKITQKNGKETHKMRLMVKKVFAVILVLVALINLLLISLSRIKPTTFILVLTFVALVSFSYYKKND